MDMTERLSVGIDGNLSGFERSINRMLSLLSQAEAAGSRVGRNFDSSFGSSVARTAQRVGLNIEQLNNRIALLTQKRNLSLDTSVIARTNREIEGLQARVSRLSNAGIDLPKLSSGTLTSLSSYASGLVGVGTGLGLVTAAARTFREVLDIADEMNRLDAGLKAVSTSSADFARMQSFLRGLSDQLGISYSALADGYKGLKASTNGTNLQGAETERIFRSVVNAGAALKLSNEEVKGSLRALTQMMSTGTVQSDELKSELASHLPNAFGLAAKAMGVTTSELSKMLERGDVLASDMLPKLATQLEKTYGKNATDNVNNLTGATARLTNQSRELIQSFDNASGASTFFASITNGAADSLRGIKQLVDDKSWAVLADQLFRLKTNPASLFVGNNVLKQSSLVAKDRQQFAGMDRTAQQARLQGLKDSIEQRRSQITDLDRGKLKDSVIKPTFYYDLKKTLANEEASLAALLSDFKKPFNQVLVSRTANASAAVNLPKPVVDYAEDFKKKEKEYDALLDKQKGLHSVSKELTKEEQARLSVLKQQLALGDKKKYGDKENKVKSESISRLGSVASMEAMLKREEDKLFTAIQNGTADKPLAGQDWQGTTQRQRTEALRKSLKEAKEEVKELRKELDFLDKLTGLNITGSGGLTRGDREKDPNTPRLATPLGTLENGKRGVNTEAYEVKAEQTNEVLRRYEESRTRFKKLPGFLQDIFKSVSVGARALDQEVTAGTDAANDVLRQKANDFSNLLEGMAQIGADFAQSALPQIGNQFFSGLADSINQGNDEPLKKALQGIKDMLSDYLIQIGTSLVIAGGLELLGAPIPGIGIGLALSGGQKLAVGGAMLAGGVGLKAAGPSRKSKGYATGGHVLGEGSSTSDSIPAWLSNGEFVMKADAVRKVGVPYLNALNDGRSRPALNRMSSTPLRLDQPNPKLSSSLNHLKGVMRDANGGGAETIREERISRVRGNDLELANVRTMKKKRAYGRDD